MSDVLFETDDDLSEANIAEWFAAKRRRDFFDRGAGVTANFSGDEVTAGSGKAFLETADEELFKLILDGQTLALPSTTGNNYLYATFDPATANQATWEIGASPGDVSDPKLLRAVVDAGASEVDLRNQGAGMARVTSRNTPYLTGGEDVIFAGGGTTVTLASADATIANHIEVFNVDGTNDVTLETEGSETFGDGSASKSISTAGWSVGITWSGGAWQTSLDGEFESVSTDAATINDQDGIGVGGSSPESPTFGTWRQPSSSRPSQLLVEVEAQTDGVDFGTILLEVDESGGTSSDYAVSIAQADRNLGENYIVRTTTVLIIPAEAQYRVVNASDPTNNNQIRVVRESIY